MNGRFEITLDAGETILHDCDGQPRGFFTGEIITDRDEGTVRLEFYVEDSDLTLRPTIAALQLRPDGHWQYPEKVLGKYTRSNC
jgi:hypothetical protein